MAKYSFSGKNILITGASGGLGSATAKLLAAEQANLAVTARSEKALKELISSLPRTVRAVAIPDKDQGYQDRFDAHDWNLSAFS